MVSLIVVDYRTIRKTCEFLAHAAEQLAPREEIHFWIVDNDPERSGQAYLAKRYPRVRQTETPVAADFFAAEFGEVGCITPGENLGYARGNNLGTRAADAVFGDDYYLICNNDLRFPEKWDLREVTGKLEKESSAAALGPRILGLDGKEQNPYRKKAPAYWLFVYPWSRFWPVHSRGDYRPLREAGECYRLMGCCLLLRADRFRECGRFDEHTFLFSEEMILSERMAGRGYTCRYEPAFTVIHEHGQTMKSAARAVEVERWAFDSLFYYCRAYRGVSAPVMGLAWVNRILNMGVIALKAGLRGLIRRIRRRR